ncbi:MAG: S8 family serine peptidase [Actinomycetota bacterium]|nr:S8 family serine peptidase [Actinomycetota bacterium]
MARYVLSHRRAGKFNDDAKRASRTAADHAFSSLFEPAADVVNRMEPAEDTAREVIVFEANPADVAAKATMVGPDVLIEPEILHFPAPAFPLDLAGLRPGMAPGMALAGFGTEFSVTVRGPNSPLLGAEVLLFLRIGSLENLLSARTDEDGKVRFRFSRVWSPAALLAIPWGNHWSMVVRGPTAGLEVICPSLPAIERLSWWHQVLGLTEPVEDLGSGVSIGVVDTGAGPHPDLDHVVLAGAFIDGNHDTEPKAGQDVDSHGSHVSGTIGGRPQGENGPVGIAPAVSLFAARVFAGPDTGANQGDIANAVDHLSRERQADLLNLSLGSPRPSEIEHDAIIDAAERGTLCICAAANSAGPVEFPAAFPEAVAVSALGLEGWGPPGSLSSTRLPTDRERFGVENLYLANFSCFGPEIDSTAPGVGIIATVPERFGLVAPYKDLDGTSMASPLACALLAAVLSGSQDYLDLPRNITRAERARSLLRQACRDIGLAARFQGSGLPSTRR